MQTKKGSAILVVIGILVILTIVTVSVMENRTKRAGFTRFMSNEKKAETIAEAVLDTTLSNIKEKSNDHDNSDDLYDLIRIAYTPESNGLVSNLDDPNYEIEIPDSYYSAIYEIFKDTQNDTFTIDKVSAKLTHIEKFTDNQAPNYKVAGIDEESKVNTNFVSSDQNANPNRSDNWKFRYMYPPTTHSPISAIKKYYEGNNYSDGLYSDEDWSSLLTSTEAREYMNFHYATPQIDIDILYKGIISKIIKLYGNFPNSTYANVLFKPGDASKSGVRDSNSCFAFGIYLDKNLIDGISKLHQFAKKLLNPPEDDDDSGWNLFEKIKSGLAKQAKKLIERGLSEEEKQALEEFLDIPEITNESLNSMVQKVMKSSGLIAQYTNGNNIDVEYLLLNYLDVFEEAKSSMSRLTVKEFLKFLCGTDASKDPTKWAEELNNIKANNSFDEQIVEKGGLLQITCEVTYTPQGSQDINKKLVAEIPFKLSDVQPVAPEYNFFVVNDSDKEINFNRTDQFYSIIPTLPTDYIILHNSNHINKTPLEKKIHPYAAFSATEPPAGKVRVNGNKIKPINLHSGGVNPNIQYTELAALLMSDVNKTNNMLLQPKATFGFSTDADIFQNFKYKSVRIHYPIISDRDTTTNYIKAKNSGLTSLVEMYQGEEFKHIFARPVLLYGFGHLDYPMGMQVEGKISQKISEMSAYVAPDNIRFILNLKNHNIIQPENGKWDEGIQLYYSLDNISKYPTSQNTEIPTSFPNLRSYKGTNVEESGLPKYLYSFNQYKKKATRYYKSANDFFDDFKVKYEDGGLNDNGEIRIDGVTYVEDDIAFDGRGANGSEYKFIGNGLIVAGKNRGSNDIFKMHIKKNITLADNSTLGLITNFLEIDQDCQIHASVYSDNAAGIKNATIFGNYIIDNFERSNYSGGFNVRYTSKNIAVPGTDFYDPNDKITNKRRYYASFANNWSNSYYAKE